MAKQAAKETAKTAVEAEMELAVPDADSAPNSASSSAKQAASKSPLSDDKTSSTSSVSPSKTDKTTRLRPTNGSLKQKRKQQQHDDKSSQQADSDHAKTTMPPSWKDRRATTAASGPPRRELDLSSFLTPDQKDELMVLVTNVTDSMQRKIENTFNAAASMGPPGAGGSGAVTDNIASAFAGANNILPTKWKILAPPTGKEVKDSGDGSDAPIRSKQAPATSYGKDSGSTDVIAPESDLEAKARSKVAKEELEAMSPSMLELKKECLSAFKKWQSSFLKRLSEIQVGRVDGPQQGRSYPAPSGPMTVPNDISSLIGERYPCTLWIAS